MFDSVKSDLSNWTLSSDQKLLDLLQILSRSIDEKASKCCEEVDDLSFDVADTEVGLRNVFNEFLMLGNTQFIENRVYDDDDDVDEEGEQETKAESGVGGVDPLVLMKDAFAFGQQALRLYYYDDSHTNKVEDIYNVRALPYIIGSQLFNESPDAGLGFVIENDAAPQEPIPELLEEIENHHSVHDFPELSRHREEKEEGAEIGDERYTEDGEYHAPKVPPPPVPPKQTTPSVAQMIAGKTNRQNVKSVDEDEDEEKDEKLFLDEDSPTLRRSSSENRSNSPEVPSLGTTRDLPAVIRPIIPLHPKVLPFEERRDSAERAIQSSASTQITKPQNLDAEEEDDIFAAQDDPYSLFSNRKSFAVKKGNVDDSLTELFGKPEVTSSKSTMRSSFSALFGDVDEASLFGEVSNNKTAVGLKDEVSNKSVGNDSSVSKQSFHAFEDLFGKSESTTGKEKTEKKGSRFNELFGGDNDLAFDGGKKVLASEFEKFPETGAKNESKLVKTTSDVFAQSSIPIPLPRPRKATESSDDISDLEENEKEPPRPVSIAALLQQPKNETVVKGPSLFHSERLKVEKSPPPVPSTKGSLFDSDETFTSTAKSTSKPSLFDSEPLKVEKSPPPVPSTKGSLFDSDETFTSTAKSTSSKPSLFDSEPLKVEKSPPPVPSTKGSLFDSDETFTSTAKSTSSKPSLFDSEPLKVEKSPPPVPSTKGSLFDSDETFTSTAKSTSKPSLFDSEPLKVEKSPPPVPSTKGSLFDSDETFTSTAKSTSSKPSLFDSEPLKVEKSPPPVPSTKGSLFDSDETFTSTAKSTSSKPSLFDSEPLKVEKSPPPVPSTKGSLFDSDETFTSTAKSTSSKPSLFDSEPLKVEKSPPPVPSTKGSLFDSDETFTSTAKSTSKPSLFDSEPLKVEKSPPPVPSTKGSLFDSDETFTSTAKSTSSKPSLFDSEPLKVEKSPPPVPSTKGSLFDSDETFTSTAKSTSSKPSLFDSEPLKVEKSPPPVPSTKGSLFDSDETFTSTAKSTSSKPSLFDSEPLKVEKSPPPVPLTKGSLFDSDETFTSTAKSTSSKPSLFESDSNKTADLVHGNSKIENVGKLSTVAANIKIILPSAAPKQQLVEKDESRLKPSVEDDKNSFESVTTANLSRPAMASRVRRAPSKKLFDSDLDPNHFDSKFENLASHGIDHLKSETPILQQKSRVDGVTGLASDSFPSKLPQVKTPFHDASFESAGPGTVTSSSMFDESSPILKPKQDTLLLDSKMVKQVVAAIPSNQGSLFDSNPQEIVLNKSSNIPSSKGSLFEDEDESIFSKPQSKAPSREKKTKSALFGDDDDPLFAPSVTSNNSSNARKKSLFDD